MIYMSYSIKDFEKSKILLQSLKDSQHQIWFDDRSREDVFSASWVRILKQKIVEANYIVFLLSTNSARSQYCKWELETAIDLQKPIVITLLDDIDDLFLENTSSAVGKDETSFIRILSEFKVDRLNITSDHDTYVSTITTEAISGEGNQVVGQQTIFNGAPVWVVGLTAASVIGVSGIVSIKMISQMGETYQVIFDNVIDIIETIGSLILQYNANSVEASQIHIGSDFENVTSEDIDLENTADGDDPDADDLDDITQLDDHADLIDDSDWDLIDY